MMTSGSDHRQEAGMSDKVLYRVEPIGRGDRSSLFVSELKVVKETKKGFWIETWVGDRKFVCKGNRSEGARKRYAYTTERDAMASFIARKQSHLGHLNALRKDVERSLYLATKKLKDPSWVEDKLYGSVEVEADMNGCKS